MRVEGRRRRRAAGKLKMTPRRLEVESYTSKSCAATCHRKTEKDQILTRRTDLRTTSGPHNALHNKAACTLPRALQFSKKCAIYSYVCVCTPVHIPQPLVSLLTAWSREELGGTCPTGRFQQRGVKARRLLAKTGCLRGSKCPTSTSVSRPQPPRSEPRVSP